MIDLAGFTLKGGSCRHLRYALKRGERDGLAFEWLPRSATARFDDLALISAEWLEARRGEEKGFSVAAFEPGFLAAPARRARSASAAVRSPSPA